ncbi:acyltransferase family protein [Paractinoplanes lichenicola]|uniref:Acyltransferase n=1 Tax=Paractinoplanes lichenicola TaxID=2802976 RepID=A0ABS1W6C6_9ACTN|nr:acyltransferase [Actinoplanes lichenicola]MBL7262301.1 acyltransferase [Actinoplanes lichenicola]
MASESGGTIRSIQILRALAATAVVYFHCSSPRGGFGFPQTGAWGVDIFFVISGFIIARTAFKRRDNFLRIRIVRVVPIYLIATFLIAGVVLALPGRVNSAEVGPVGLLKSILFIPYEMATRPGPILEAGWTLNYEMFFYVVVALALLVTRSAKRGLAVTGVLLGLLAVSGWVAPSDWYVVRFYQSSLFLEFLSGVLLWMAYEKSRDIRGVFAAGRTTIAGGFMIAAGIALLVAEDTWPAFTIESEGRFLQYGLPAFVVVAGGLLVEPALPAGRSVTSLVELGDASYALYLFHPFVILFLSRIAFESVLTEAATAVRLLLLLLALALSLAASVVINRYIDGPIQRRLRSRVLSPGRSATTPSLVQQAARRVSRAPAPAQPPTNRNRP